MQQYVLIVGTRSPSTRDLRPRMLSVSFDYDSYVAPKPCELCQWQRSWLQRQYCDQHICQFVCPLACSNSKTTHPLSSNSMYTLPVAVSRSSSDASAIHYVLPVLWITSWFHTRCSLRWQTLPPVPPSGKLDETYAVSLILPIRCIMWKHDVIHKTGST